MKSKQSTHTHNQTNKNGIKKEKAQRPHTTISHTFIGVMPIVASCWQNEFPRNLFALKTCNKQSTHGNSHIHMVLYICSMHIRSLLGPLKCAAHTIIFPGLSSPNFWFIINDHYHAVSVLIACCCWCCCYCKNQHEKKYEIGFIKSVLCCTCTITNIGNNMSDLNPQSELDFFVYFSSFNFFYCVRNLRLCWNGIIVAYLRKYHFIKLWMSAVCTKEKKKER